MLKFIFNCFLEITGEAKQKLESLFLEKRKKRNLDISYFTIEKIQYQLHKNEETLPLNSNEKHLVERIRSQTEEMNRNNVTRTQAYLDFYLKHPELHWALLAHMVSRNGGWNMTDLKGNLLSKFLNTEKTHSFFSFLERSNALIFQDAYPQLLLYEASKEQNQNFFHLLSKFHISKFMKPFWDEFLREENSELITLALIINEQNYIEHRVVQNEKYKEKVLDTLAFNAQEFFQFTKVVFPFTTKNNNIELAGISVSDFKDLDDRIKTGKKLYSILFFNNKVFEGVKRFALNSKHTGSRSDYWPHIFTNKKLNLKANKENTCSKHSLPIVYSPFLTPVWPDKQHQFNDSTDWYNKKMDLWNTFSQLPVIKDYNITDEYCELLNKLVVLTWIKD